MQPDFVEWLQEQLRIRGWTQSDLTKRGNVSAAAISKIISRERKPGPEVCLAIATALSLPPETVFRAAGLLPPVPEVNDAIAEAMEIFSRLSEADQREFLEYLCPFRPL